MESWIAFRRWWSGKVVRVLTYITCLESFASTREVNENEPDSQQPTSLSNLARSYLLMPPFGLRPISSVLFVPVCTFDVRARHIKDKKKPLRVLPAFHKLSSTPDFLPGNEERKRYLLRSYRRPRFWRPPTCLRGLIKWKLNFRGNIAPSRKKRLKFKKPASELKGMAWKLCTFEWRYNIHFRGFSYFPNGKCTPYMTRIHMLVHTYISCIHLVVYWTCERNAEERERDLILKTLQKVYMSTTYILHFVPADELESLLKSLHVCTEKHTFRLISFAFTLLLFFSTFLFFCRPATITASWL